MVLYTSTLLFPPSPHILSNSLHPTPPPVFPSTSSSPQFPTPPPPSTPVHLTFSSTPHVHPPPRQYSRPPQVLLNSLRPTPPPRLPAISHSPQLPTSPPRQYSQKVHIRLNSLRPTARQYSHPLPIPSIPRVPTPTQYSHPPHIPQLCAKLHHKLLTHPCIFWTLPFPPSPRCESTMRNSSLYICRSTFSSPSLNTPPFLLSHSPILSV